MQRLMARDGLDEEQARNRVDAQMSQQRKVARADYVIDNSGSRDETLRQARELFRRLAGQSPPSSPDPR